MKIHISVIFSLGTRENQTLPPKLKLSCVTVKHSSLGATDLCTSVPEITEQAGAVPAGWCMGHHCLLHLGWTKIIIDSIFAAHPREIIECTKKLRQIHVQDWLFLWISPAPHPIQHIHSLSTSKTIKLFTFYRYIYKYICKYVLTYIQKLPL